MSPSSVLWCALASTLLIVCGGVARGDRPQRPAAGPALRLVSRETDRALRGYFPQVDDPEVRQLLQDPRLVLYTDREMPRAYQFWSGLHNGVHGVEYNISANGSEPYGNGNREFPWSAPAGTHRADNVRSFRFFRLPRDEQGRTLPVVWYRQRLSGDADVGYAWTYPAGTVFGEVLLLHGPDDRDYTFELRLRIRELDDWAVDVFRPFPTAADLAERIRQLRPDWATRPKLAQLVGHLQEPRELPLYTLADDHPRKTFDQVMGVDTLPDVGDDALVAELLESTTFSSALGKTWRRGSNGARTFAPTTSAPFHVVPAGYQAGYIAVNRDSCLRCHETVNRNVARFEPGRDWYGRIRGADGIFSFHPFDPASVSHNGYPRSVALRRELLDAGVLERYDAARHSADYYRRVPGLE